MAGDSEEKCVKKMNRLVYAQPTGERHNRPPPCVSSRMTHRPPICRVKPKPIRVCTGADMKKMVPPRICDCKPKGLLRGGSGLVRLLVFGLKAAVAAGAVYVSYDLGVWGTIDQTQEMYRTFCEAKTAPQKRKSEKWSPPACEAERSLHAPSPFNPYSHCDTPPLDLEHKGVRWGSCWNSGVEYVFSALAGFPYNIMNKLKGVHIPMYGKSQKAEVVHCIPYNELPEDEKVVNNYKR